MSRATQTTSAIDRIFAEWHRPRSPGVAVAVIQRGEPVYVRCHGLANVEHGVPIGTTTVFEIGSITKQFTGLALLMLERDGLLCLDDEVRAHLPDLPPLDPPVRLRHCLYHAHGLPDWLVALELAGPASDYTPVKRAYRTIAALRQTMFPAGSAHSYSNTGYVLLAWVIARVTGRPLPEFLQERVFGPLGMAQSAFRSDPFDFVVGQAQGYIKGNGGALLRTTGSTGVHGDGGMLASIGDMGRWLSNFTSSKVGDAALFERLFAPGRLDDGRPIRYGAGWIVDRYRGLRCLHHGGVCDGFQSHVVWLPEPGIGVAVLGNSRPFLPWCLATEAANILLESHGGPPPPASRRRSRAGARDGQGGLAGRYVTAAGWLVTVDWHDGSLRVDIGLWARLFERQSGDIFEEVHSGDSLAFHRDPQGTVTHLTMEAEDGACIHMHSFVAMARKYVSAPLDDEDLAGFEGRYVNEEVESAYTVVAEGTELVARHLRCDDWRLHPIMPVGGAFENHFAQDGDWPGIVTFERGQDGSTKGFRVRGARVDLAFMKRTRPLSHEY